MPSQPNAASPLPRYRNQTVYQSAEQLIAAVSRQRKRRFPRWFYLAAGLIIGAELSVMIFCWRVSSPVVAPAPAALPAETIAPAINRHQQLERALQRAYARDFAYQPNARLILAGGLSGDAAAPVRIEFELEHPPGFVVRGVVRYRHANGNRITERKVEGEIRGRAITLRETLHVAPDDSEFPFGRAFALQLPPDQATLEVTGGWALPSARGEIELKVVP